MIGQPPAVASPVTCWGPNHFCRFTPKRHPLLSLNQQRLALTGHALFLDCRLLLHFCCQCNPRGLFCFFALRTALTRRRPGRPQTGHPPLSFRIMGAQIRSLMRLVAETERENRQLKQLLQAAFAKQNMSLGDFEAAGFKQKELDMTIQLQNLQNDPLLRHEDFPPYPSCR